MLWLFVLMSASLLLFQEGAVNSYDGRTMYEVTKSMVDRGSFAISREWNTLPGRGGLYYGRYGLGLSLVSAVPYVLVQPLAHLSGHPEYVSSAAVDTVMPFTAAALALALYLLAKRMGASVGSALFVGVGAVIGTFMLPYSKEFFSEPLATLCLILAIERLLAGRPATAGLAMGAAVLTRPQTALFAPVVLFVAWRRQGMAAAARAVAALTPGLLVTFAYNIVRFGGPWRFGYQDVGFTTPFLVGARGLLFDPKKSVFLFAPIVLLLPFALHKLWKEHRWAFLLVTSNLAITFVVTATWFAWHGGWSWGPRLLLPGLLPAFAAIGPWLSTPTRRRAAALLLAVGFLVSFPAMIVSTGAQLLEVPPPAPDTGQLATQPLSSPSVTRQVELIPASARYSVEHLYQNRPDGLDHLRSLSFWQLGVIRVVGRPGLPLSAAGTALLLIVAVVGYRKLRPALRDLSDLDRSVHQSDPEPPDGYPGVTNLESMQFARHYNDFLTSTVMTSADPSRPILDFGAGIGTHANGLRDLGLQVRCVEPDPGLRAKLKQEGFEVSASALDYGREAFASVYSLNVLEHIQDDAAAVRDLFAVTAPGGVLTLYVPAFGILFSAMDRAVGHVRRYRKAQLASLVEAAGFQVKSCRYVDSLGFFVALAYRVLGGGPELNPTIMGLYDKFVFPLSRAIDRLTARWFGKNLLLVARRD